MKLTYIGMLLCLTISFYSFSQTDNTPGVLYEKIYVWGKKAKYSKGVTRQTCTPFKGYVMLKDGTLYNGTLSMSRFESKDKVWRDQFSINTSEGQQNLTKKQILSYGCDFKIRHLEGNIYFKKYKSKLEDGSLVTVTKWVIKQAEDPATLPSKGTVILNSGDSLPGIVMFDKQDRWTKKVPQFYRLYLAASADENVTVFKAREIDHVLKEENGVPRKYRSVDDLFVDNVLAANTYLDGEFSGMSGYYKKPQDGVVKLMDGTELTGKTLISQGRSRIVHITPEKDIVYLKATDVIEMTLTDDKGISTLYYGDDETFMNQTKYEEKMKKLLAKISAGEKGNPRKNLQQGYILFGDGTKLEGGVAQFNRSSSDFNTIYYLAPGADMLEVYTFGMDIAHFMQVIDGKEEYYLPWMYGFKSNEDLVKRFESKSSDDLSKSLSNGYIVYKDGTKKMGQLALRKNRSFAARNLFFVDEKGIGSRVKSEELEYAIQEIYGVEHKYTRVQDVLVEEFGHDKAFSFYRNPYPTHVREGLTRMVATAAIAANAGINSAIEGGEFDANELLSAIGDSLKAEAEEMALEYVATGDVSYQGEEAIYFKEYFLKNTSSNRKVILYAESIDELARRYTERCGLYLEKSELKKVSNLSDLTPLIEILNSNSCQNKVLD